VRLRAVTVPPVIVPFALACASGVLSCLAFPPVGLWPLAFLAPWPLALAEARALVASDRIADAHAAIDRAAAAGASAFDVLLARASVAASDEDHAASERHAREAIASAPARPTPTSTSPPSPTTALNPPYAARSGIRVPRSAPTPRRPLLLHTPRRSFCPQAFRSARARALLLVTRLCSVARIPAFCPLAPHTPTGLILGRGPSLLLF
jgi:hypothetical protein